MMVAMNILTFLVLIQSRPSPHDLRAVGVVVEMADQAHKRLCFVVNGATPRSPIALEAVQALVQHGPVAPVIRHQQNRLRRQHDRPPHRGRDQPAVPIGRRNGGIMAIRHDAITSTE